jgi:hypothetical protein
MQMNEPTVPRRRLRAGISTGTLALACLMAAGAPAMASSGRPAAPVTAPDTIRGIVFDSLLHQPIPEATVQADAGSASTLTDKEGRFTLIAPETIRRVTVFHDFLDRSGLGSLIADVTDKTSHSMMVLSTPSLATIWARLCPGKALEKGRSGIVFGSVRAADGRTRLAGALVRVSWDFNAPTAKGQIGPAVRTSDAKTDSTGSYYACGAPPTINVYVLGYSSTLRSGAVTILGDTLPLRRADLVLGEFGKTATIRGIVRDPHKAPLIGATIDVDGMDVSTKTDANGRFTIANVPTGSRTLGARALPFAPMLQPIAVLEKQNDEIQVDMLATALPGISVTGRQNISQLHLEIDQRRREGFGTIKDSTEIVRHTSIRSIFQGIPSLVITGKDATAFGLFTPGQSLSTNNPAGGCPANIYIDGKPSDTDVLISLSKEQIAAIEVYIRQEFAPAKYLLLQNNCGVVLVWTKLELKNR